MVLMPIKSEKEEQTEYIESPTLKQLDNADKLPGDRIRLFRTGAGLTQRALAKMCNPPMDFSAIGRIERNQGYTSSTLNRLADALNCDVADFFLPAEILGFKKLPADMKQEISQTIRRYCVAAKAE